MYSRQLLRRVIFCLALLATATTTSRGQDAATATTQPPQNAEAPLTPREAALLDQVRKLELRVEALEHASGAMATQTAPATGAVSSSVAASQPVATRPATSHTTATAAATTQQASNPEVVAAPPLPDGKSVKLYGRVELDTLYSSRETNPLDPRQFNGYSTAAGPLNPSSATFNPRFTVVGLEASTHSGSQTLNAKIETDFYSTDSANDITPRLRLAYVEYSRGNTKATFGMDWLPVAQLLPDLLDFSIMGYTGNVWQRIPQLTLRQKFGQHWEVLGTAFRFERGFTLQPAPFVSNPFTDPVKTPYIGTRVAYQNWGANKAGMFAISGAYRQFSYPTTHQTIASDLIAAELVVPVTSKLKWNSKIAHGQALGDEFFRFGQSLNGTIPIKTTTGWTELAYSATKRLTFASGYGLDNPLGKDLAGISNNSENYHRNARFFGDTVFDLYHGVSVGLEVNYLHTNWTDGSKYTAYQPMASFFYSF